MIRSLISNIKYAWPNIISCIFLIPFFPLESSSVTPFVAATITTLLTFHHIDPQKAIVKLSRDDMLVILTNIINTIGGSYFFIKYTSNNLISVNSLTELDYNQFLHIPVWVFVHELLFFYVHKFAHTRDMYSSIFFNHKMHHKFKVTSSWTSFYAHPIDHFVSVLCITLLLPFYQLYYLENKIYVPVFVIYAIGALITFISSHHVKYGENNLHGTDHLEHHMLFSYNYGNFGVFDKIYGTYKKKICL